MIGRLMRRTAALTVAIPLWLACNSIAAASVDTQAVNDEVYCRFFVDDIIGDVSHVSEVTGISDVFFLFSDGDWDYYAFSWGDYLQYGVILRFHLDGGDLSVMKGSIGFEPQVNYWECH